MPRLSRSGFPYYYHCSHTTVACKAAVEATGFATSKIGCPCEAGLKDILKKKETPDGRVGVSILICADKKTMKSHVASRISQCILPAPTASAYDGFPEAGSRFLYPYALFWRYLRERCTVHGRKCWKIPTIGGQLYRGGAIWDPEGIAGGNFLVMGKDQMSALTGLKLQLIAINELKGVITSFAGGIVASGSKLGCKNYRFPMPASTNHVWCPTLKGKISNSKIPDGVGSV